MATEASKLEKYECVKEMRSEMCNDAESTKFLYEKNLLSFMTKFGVSDLDVFIAKVKAENKEKKAKGEALDAQDKIIRDYNDMLMKDVANELLATNTAQSRIQALMALFRANGLKCEKKHKIRVYAKRNLDIPSQDFMEKLLRVADVRSKAVITILASSGMRRGELRELTLKNVKFDQELTTITIEPRMTKSKRGRRTFISKEATNCLKAYLKKRESMGHKLDDSAPLIATLDNRKVSACVMWRIIMQSANLVEKNESDKALEFSPHSLRRYFITMMMTAGIPMGMVNYLSGHVGYLSESYEKWRDEDLAKEYLRGMERVTILEKASTVDELDAELRLLKARARAKGLSNEDFERRVHDLKIANNGEIGGIHYNPKLDKEQEIEAYYKMLSENESSDGNYGSNGNGKKYIVRKNGNTDMVVTEAELGDYLGQGYKFISSI